MEIRTLLEQEGYEPCADADEAALLSLLHSRTRCPSAIARRIDSILQERSRSPRDRIRFLEPDEISLGRMSNEDPAGLLFALSTDPRKPVQTLALWLRFQIIVRGIRALVNPASAYIISGSK
jgi:hypothetical protein